HGSPASSLYPLSLHDALPIFADDAIVVTNPEVSSVRDSDRMLGILASKSRRAELGLEPIKEYLLLTRYAPQRVKLGEMLSVEDRSEEHTSELQSRENLVCRLL